MGLKILNPDPGQASSETLRLDIVAVHGLSGDPVNTWTEPKSKAFWPKDFLPNDLPGSRIMTFGYNADAAFGNSTANVIDHAKDLLGSLIDEREHEDVRDQALHCYCHLSNFLSSYRISEASFIFVICTSSLTGQELVENTRAPCYCAELCLSFLTYVVDRSTS